VSDELKELAAAWKMPLAFSRVLAVATATIGRYLKKEYRKRRKGRLPALVAR
jgi:hypothetical protein